MLLSEQQINQRPVHPGPRVLRTAPLKYPTPTPDTGSYTHLDVYKRQVTDLAGTIDTVNSDLVSMLDKVNDNIAERCV